MKINHYNLIIGGGGMIIGLIIINLTPNEYFLKIENLAKIVFVLAGAQIMTIAIPYFEKWLEEMKMVKNK